MDGEYCGNSELQLTNLSVYFNEASGGRAVPRSICTDLDSESIDSISAEPIGHLFNPDNLIRSHNSAGNNWARGFYTEGAELLDIIMESVRREAEN